MKILGKYPSSTEKQPVQPHFRQAATRPIVWQLYFKAVWGKISSQFFEKRHVTYSNDTLVLYSIVSVFLEQSNYAYISAVYCHCVFNPIKTTEL